MCTINFTPQQRKVAIAALEGVIENKFQWLADYGDSTTNTIESGDRETTIQVKNEIRDLEIVIDKLSIWEWEKKK